MACKKHVHVSYKKTLGVYLTSCYEDNSIMCGGKPRSSNKVIFANDSEISGTKFDRWFYIVHDATDMPEVILGLSWLNKFSICLTFSNEKRTLTDSKGNIVSLITID